MKKISSKRSKLESLTEHLAIARHRDALREEHARYGKELHERKFGANASIENEQLQARRGQTAKSLEDNRLSLRLSDNECNPRRQHSVAHPQVAYGNRADCMCSEVFQEMVRERNAEVRAKRAQSQAWAEATVRHRTMTSSATSTMAFSARERQKAEVERWKRNVPDFAELRAHLEADLERKRMEAAVVRTTNEIVESNAKRVLAEGAQQRKEVHDSVKVNKRIVAPVPLGAGGAGGVIGSRKAFAALEGVTLVPSKKGPLPATAEFSPAGLRFRSSPYARAWPLGIAYDETPAGIVVTDVAAGSAAANLNVPLGGVILAVNALPLSGMTLVGVKKAIGKANWPMTLQIAPCMKFEFDQPGPIGLLVADSQNGVVVRKLTEGSVAEEKGIPVGALLVEVNETSAAGVNKAEIDSMLKARPLTLKVVPRDASYLFRSQRGVGRGRASATTGL